jgi:hypothetical protein
MTLVVAVAALWGKRRLAQAGGVSLSPAMASALDDIERRSYPRPVHRGVSTPGRFGAALDELGWPASALRLATSPCPAGAKGEEPACRDFLAATHASLVAFLGATLRAEGGLGPARGILAPLGSGETVEVPAFAASTLGADQVPLWSSVPRATLAVCKRATLEVDVESAHGDGAGALQTCSDTIAWARDTALGGNMVELMLTLACVRIAHPACARAMRAAEPAQREELARALDVVRRGMPEVGEVARADLTVGWLRMCGPLLNDASRARLSPVQALAGSEVERVRLSVGAPSPGPIDRANAARGCREEEAKTLAQWKESASDVAASEDIKKYGDEASTVYGLIDALIAEGRGR